MPLNSTQIEAIAKQVYQKFPELRGIAPEVQSQQAPGAKSFQAAAHYLVIFKSRGRQNPAINQVVRVTADLKGRVLKMSTSR